MYICGLNCKQQYLFQSFKHRIQASLATLYQFSKCTALNALCGALKVFQEQLQLCFIDNITSFPLRCHGFLCIYIFNVLN